MAARVCSGALGPNMNAVVGGDTEDVGAIRGVGCRTQPAARPTHLNTPRRRPFTFVRVEPGRNHPALRGTQN